MEFIKAYGPKLRVTVRLPGPKETGAKQSFKDECDINRIMARFSVTGMLDFVNKYPPQYLDVTGTDYVQAMTVVAEANSMFHELPSEVRKKFDNSPAAFLDFCKDPKNMPEMRAMGLAKPEKRQEPAAPAPPLEVAPGANAPGG